MDEPQTTLTAKLKAFPHPLWVLFGGTFLNKFGTFVMPFLALYMTQKGFTLAQTGAALSAYGLGNFLASGLGGHLADTLGRRNTIVFSMFSGAVAMLLLSQAQSFGALLVTTALTGLTNELYRPASSALMADLVPAGQRVTAYAAYRLAFNAGFAFGPATAGFLAGHSYTWLFVGDAISSALFGVVAFVALPHGVRAIKADQSWRPALRAMAHDHPFLRMLAASLVISLVFLQMGSTLGLQITSRGFSAATYGILLSLNGLLVVVFELPLTTITQNFRARRTMAAGYVMIGAGFAVLAVAKTVPEMVLAIVVFTFGEMISIPVSAAYVADLAPTAFRGRYSGTVGLTNGLALIFGPSLGMRVFGKNPNALWMGCGVLGLLAAAVISSGKERPKIDAK